MLRRCMRVGAIGIAEQILWACGSSSTAFLGKEILRLVCHVISLVFMLLCSGCMATTAVWADARENRPLRTRDSRGRSLRRIKTVGSWFLNIMSTCSHHNRTYTTSETISRLCNSMRMGFLQNQWHFVERR